MSIPDNFFETLKVIEPKDLLKKLSLPGEKTKCSKIIEITNEIKPADLFCYLAAKFGEPNGLQNFLRQDDSDNLIHWEWALSNNTATVIIQGHNFRSEIHISGEFSWEDSDMNVLILQIKKDFNAFGSGMSEVRKSLENWVEFVNPYQRIRRAVDKLFLELNALELNLESEPIHETLEILSSRSSSSESKIESVDKWNEIAAKYSKGFGLCFGIRSLLPVMAESFVNLIMYALMKPEIKSDSRLYEASFRQPIDVRIKRLAIDCNGFTPEKGKGDRFILNT